MLFLKKRNKKQKRIKASEEEIEFLTNVAQKKDLLNLVVPLAYTEIKSLSGSPSYNETYRTERFTLSQSLNFFIKKYNAKKVTFTESLEYLPSDSARINEAKTQEDPIAYLTYNDLNKDSVIPLVFPISLEKKDDGFEAKNGFIAYLDPCNDVLNSVWISPVTIDYEKRLKAECIVLTDHGMGFYVINKNY